MENNAVYLVIGPSGNNGSHVIAVYADKRQAQERAEYFNNNPVDGETGSQYYVEPWSITQHYS